MSWEIFPEGKMIFGTFREAALEWAIPYLRSTSKNVPVLLRDQEQRGQR
jgi:hypothetical protein